MHLADKDVQLFWRNLTPANSPQAKFDSYSTFKQQVEKDFGSLENLKNEINTKTAAVQGSGWGWLGYNKASQRLEVVTTANQDPLLSASNQGRTVDEPALIHVSACSYHRHRHLGARLLPAVQERQARREYSAQTHETRLMDYQYLKAIWDVINFEEAEKRLQAAK